MFECVFALCFYSRMFMCLNYLLMISMIVMFEIKVKIIYIGKFEVFQSFSAKIMF